MRPLSSAPHPAHGLKNQLGLGLPPLENRRSDCFLHDLFGLPDAASHLLGVMPNPWRGYELIRGTFDALLKRYPREQVTGSYGDAFHQVFVIGTGVRVAMERKPDVFASFRRAIRVPALHFAGL